MLPESYIYVANLGKYIIMLEEDPDSMEDEIRVEYEDMDVHYMYLQYRLTFKQTPSKL